MAKRQDRDDIVQVMQYINFSHLHYFPPHKSYAECAPWYIMLPAHVTDSFLLWVVTTVLLRDCIAWKSETKVEEGEKTQMPRRVMRVVEEKSDADGGNAEDVDSEEETDWTYSIFQFYSTTFHSLCISQYVKVASIIGLVCWHASVAFV